MNAPKLRFKEFKDEYINLKYKDVLKIKSGKDQKKVECGSGIYPILGTGGQIGKTNSFLYDKPSVLIGRKGTINKPQYMETPFWTVDTLFYSHIYEPNIPKYLFYSFQNVNWKKYDESTGVPSLSSSTIESVECNIPSKEEQLKVADFLSLLDKKIELQSKRIEDLKLFKKGLSTTILNSLRDFEEYKLGKICNITTGKLDANAMIDNGKYRFYTCAKEYSLIDKYAFDTEALLISGNGAYVGYIHYYKGKFNAYQRTYVLDNFSQNIQFIKCYLEENLAKRINSEKKEGNTPYIVLSTLSDMVIKIPSQENQIKISNIINCHNKKIELEENKLLKLQELKKGLMQSMFV